MAKGWHQEYERHALAGMGIKTGRKEQPFSFRYYIGKKPVDKIIKAKSFNDAKKKFEFKTGQSVFSAIDGEGKSYTEEGEF